LNSVSATLLTALETLIPAKVHLLAEKRPMAIGSLFRALLLTKLTPTMKAIEMTHQRVG